mmetsp:Transcript_11102/g.12213  ORF Transcript_11102/g.12213 Transcript_11102/m.12213 type:complete len:212 (-) Transcript_11102:181-816(-)
MWNYSPYNWPPQSCYHPPQAYYAQYNSPNGRKRKAIAQPPPIHPGWQGSHQMGFQSQKLAGKHKNHVQSVSAYYQPTQPQDAAPVPQTAKKQKTSYITQQAVSTPTDAQTNDMQEELQFNEELVARFAKTKLRRQERERKRKIEMKKEARALTKRGRFVKANEILEVDEDSVGYGSHSGAIKKIEDSLDKDFNSLCKKLKPSVWPALSLSV